MGKDMEKEVSNGIMDKLLTGYGSRVGSKGLECGSHRKEIHIKVIGRIIGRMVEGFILIMVDQSMKGNLKIISNMALGFSNFPMEIDTKAIIKRGCHMVKGNTFGQMGMYMKGISNWVPEKESGF